MQHRHLITVDETRPYTLAAIDDIIERGGMADWAELARATIADKNGQLSAKILRLCMAHAQDESQSFRVWQLFAQKVNLNR